MKYELRRMRKLSPGLTVNNSGGAGKGSVILMGEEAWKPAGSAGFPEELSPVAGRDWVLFASFLHLMIERFWETCILLGTFAMTRRFFST